MRFRRKDKMKLFWLLVSITLSLVFVLPLPADSAKPAVVIYPLSCGGLDGNGVPIDATSSRNVVTSNGNGLLICTAQVTPSATGKSVQFNGSADLPCGMIYNGIVTTTPDWKETVSSSGEMILSCHFYK